MTRTSASSYRPAGTNAVELAARVAVTTPTATVTIGGLSSAYRQVQVHWVARHDVSTGVGYALYLRINGDTSALYSGMFSSQTNTTVSPSALIGATFGRVGVIGGTTVPTAVGQFGGGVITFHSWNTSSPTLTRLYYTHQGEYYENSSVCYYEHGGQFYNASPPYTSISLFSSTGNIQVGSEFSVFGYA